MVMARADDFLSFEYLAVMSSLQDMGGKVLQLLRCASLDPRLAF